MIMSWFTEPRLLVFPYAAVVCFVVGCAGNEFTHTRDATVTIDESGGTRTEKSIKTVNGLIVEQLIQEWETGYILGHGEAKVQNKYADQDRNRELARRSARVLAERDLLERSGTIQLDSETTVNDLEISDQITRTVQGELHNVKVVREDFDEERKTWQVTVSMPKVIIARVIRDSYK